MTAVSHPSALAARPAAPGVRRRRREGGPVVLLFRILLGLIYGVPVLWIIVTSLKGQGDVLSDSAMFVFAPTVEAYTTALTSDGLLLAGMQSVIIAVGATALTLVIAIPAAYALARIGGPLATWGLGALIVLQMMPQTATVIPLFQVFGNWGLLDNRIGVILADGTLLTPFAILLLRPFFRAVPGAIEEAASIDGASTFRTFRSVVLPIARNGVATTATLVFLLSWGEFLYAINFLLSPGTYPLSALLAQQVSAFGINWPGLMALAVITSVPILILFLFTYRLLREGLTVGAVK
jgi:multiple sugar transport system permease protein